MNNRDDKTTSQEHPKEKANRFSKFFYWWGLKELYKGYKKTINEDNLYENLKEHDAKHMGDKLQQIWEQELRLFRKPSLQKAIIRFLGWKFIANGLLSLFWQLSFSLFLPSLTRNLLDIYTLDQTPAVKQQIYLHIVGIMCIFLFRIFSSRSFFLYYQTIGMKVRIACSALIYRKSLRLDKNTLRKTTIGQIINLISNDVKRFDFAFIFYHWLWIVPADLIFSFFSNYIYVGNEAIVGIPILLACFIFQGFMSRFLSNLRERVAIETDKRFRLVSDVINGIQIIKMYTWEKSFYNLIETARRSELEFLFKTIIVKGILAGLKFIVSRLCLFLLVVTYVLTDKPLTPQTIFASAIFYEALKLSVSQFFPVALTLYAEMKVSINRIEIFLLEKEKPSKLDLHNSWWRIPKTNKINNCYESHPVKDVKFDVGIEAKKLCFKWSSQVPYNNINNMDFEASSQDLVAIIGLAGSGKSTLLQLLTKTVEADTGTLNVRGSMSYASQEPWIFSATVKQNIIFNQKFDIERYDTVIRVCALEYDLALFPHGDQSLVGDRGMLLSGGQKARINLARAIYKNADIYFLDDPLSAVDVHVSSQIFQQSICNFLKHKCVVLVTNQFQYLHRTNKIVVLDKGSIVTQGPYDQIYKLKNVHELLRSHLHDQEKSANITTEKCPQKPGKKPVKSNNIKECRTEAQMSLWTIIRRYSTAGGACRSLFGIVFASVLIQFLGTFFDFFTTFWVNLEQEKTDNLTVTTDSIKFFFTTNNNLIIYNVLLFLLLFAIGIRCWVFSKFSITASKNLHSQMLDKVLYSPMKFFTITPCGQLLNRFSKDLGLIDEMLPRILLDSTQLILNAIGRAIYICILNVWVIPQTVVLFVLCTVSLYFYINSSRNMIRISAAKYSPLFSYLEASLRGLTTIKVAEAQEMLESEFDHHQSAAASAHYITICCQITFHFWIDMCCLLYTVSIISQSFLVKNEVFVGNVGVSMMQLLGVVGMLPYCLRCLAELDLYSVSIERMLEYADLSPEGDDDKETPPEQWPNKGTIQYQQVSLKYTSEDCFVLKQINFNVKNGEKIGIIGRTGAGKSSLVAVLFRMFNFDGNIIIDGVNTKKLSLKNLRSRISIIPQNPILFLGTLRKNLDPLNQYTDSEIWSAIEEVELKKSIKSLACGLNTEVVEDGRNFSVGEKQLLCLARVILQKSKIIVLDEATANVDVQTDEFIQKAIKTKFANCTVLTIAHRLNTVMNSDRILVIDDGHVIAFASPDDLIKHSDFSIL